MLGRHVADPDGIEGPPGNEPGLALLDIETVIGMDKALDLVQGREIGTETPVAGYEMHMGRTEGPDGARPWLRLDDGRAEGAIAESGKVRGSYVHGLFACDAFRDSFLRRIRDRHVAGTAYDNAIERTLDALAAHLEPHLDVDSLLAAAR